MRITRRTFLFSAAATIVGAAAPTGFYLHHENNAPELCALDAPVHGLPRAFDGFTLAVISDLHAKVFEPGQEPLLKLLRQAEPQAVAFVGDMLDIGQAYKDKGGHGVALDLAAKIVKIAPLLWVPGNHEWYLGAAASMTREMEALGALPLPGRLLTLSRLGQRLHLAGTWDYPSSKTIPDRSRDQVGDVMAHVPEGECIVLLSHRPLMELYKEFKVSLALCGHNHGGQIRIPGLGGIVAPGLQFFPRYDAGIFQEGSTTLAVTRGLGNSSFPWRINNRPEVLLLTLRTA